MYGVVDGRKCTAVCNTVLSNTSTTTPCTSDYVCLRVLQLTV